MFVKFVGVTLLVWFIFMIGLFMGLHHEPLYKSNIPMTPEHDMVYTICNRISTASDRAKLIRLCDEMQEITGVAYASKE